MVSGLVDLRVKRSDSNLGFATSWSNGPGLVSSFRGSQINNMIADLIVSDSSDFQENF